MQPQVGDVLRFADGIVGGPEHQAIVVEELGRRASREER
jgi:hypothetical protein